MKTLPIQSSHTNSDWAETLRDHSDLEIPANAKLKITDAGEALCNDANELLNNQDSTDVINYLFQRALMPFDSKITIDSEDAPSLKISPKKRTYSIKTTSPLTISIRNIIRTIKAAEVAKKMASGELPYKLDFKPREILLITDIAEEKFKDHSMRQIPHLNEALNKKAPKTHYFDIISDDKLKFVTLGPGLPSGISLRSDSKFTIRLVKKEEYADLHLNNHYQLRIATESDSSSSPPASQIDPQ